MLFSLSPGIARAVTAMMGSRVNVGISLIAVMVA
jgi:hypothetical protein